MTTTQPPLSQQIHTALRADILAGRLEPGAALPSERQLSEQLGANRHAIREALKRLQQAGLVRISQGGATRVRDWRHEGGLDLLIGLAQAGETPPELDLPRAALEMRACIGADAARLCARRAPAVARAELPARAAELEATKDLDARHDIYERMWQLIVEHCGNVAYRLALNTLLAGQKILRVDAALEAEELKHPEAIRGLVSAIADGDEAQADARARELLTRSVPAES